MSPSRSSFTMTTRRQRNSSRHCFALYLENPSEMRSDSLHKSRSSANVHTVPIRRPSGRRSSRKFRERIREAGHPLQITGENPAEFAETETDIRLRLRGARLAFLGTPASELVTTLRQFPLHMAADVQVAIDRLFSSPVDFFGIHEEYRQELDFAQLLRDGQAGAGACAAAISRDRHRRR